MSMRNDLEPVLLRTVEERHFNLLKCLLLEITTKLDEDEYYSLIAWFIGHQVYGAELIDLYTYQCKGDLELFANAMKYVSANFIYDMTPYEAVSVLRSSVEKIKRNSTDAKTNEELLADILRIV